MILTKTKFTSICTILLSLCSVGVCGKIVYPWNATTAIVKAGDPFTVWFDGDAGQAVKSVQLRGPFNSVAVPEVTSEAGLWTYDTVPGATYNTRVSVSVPPTTPEERYDLVLKTSTGQEISYSAVKVVKALETDYTIFHISDTHMCDESVRPQDGVPARLRYLSVLVDTANIIGPEMVFLTGDNVNSRSWDAGNATYLTTWPSTQERIDFYYKGSHKDGLQGVHDFSAPAFSCNGNHDYYERPADGLETGNKNEFWNKYHGLRTHHFTYGDARFMAFCDAFDRDNDAEAVQHSAWLNEVGPGTLRVIYKHFFNIVPQPWAKDHDIQFGMVGHNHHKGVLNPHTQGTTDMYIANFTEYTTFNLFRVDEQGEYTVLNNLPAIENPKDDPSEWRRRLTLDYAKANDGSSYTNTATLVNHFDVGFPRARIRFVMPKGASYTVSKGTVTQAFDGDSVHVVDVRVNLMSHSTTEIKIRQAGVPEPTLAEVSYGEHERHVLDFWQADSNTPTPLAFVIHGGGWQGGSKERVARFVDIERLLAAGISVAAINYRYVSHASDTGIEPPVKLPLYDAARALQFIRSRARKWNIDKTRIGAAGGSAGACSSLWLAYHDDLADPESSDPIARESTRLQCAAVIGAQTTLDPKQMKAWTPNSRYGGHAFGKRNFQQFLSERETILPWISEYSPYALVTEDDPPVCLLYSAPPALGQVQKDPTHTSNFGVKLQDKCKDVGVPCEFVYTAGAKTRHTMASDFLIKILQAPASSKYSDGRPAATLRMNAEDQGIVLRYGDGPGQCDILGARDVWVFEEGGTYYMHYDAAGPKGWLSSLAVSRDIITWEKKGPILDFGKPDEDDSAGACYGVTYKDKYQWHMFYLGTPNASPEPDLVPSFPYLTMKAKASDLAGPWIKQKDVVPFRTKLNTYYSLTASPGHVIKNAGEYLQFFSATTRKPGNPCVQRTLGIARTKDLDGPWVVDPKPIVPIEEQIENSTLYYERSHKTWFLFTNHIGINKGEYTDAIWVYWSKDLNKWDPANKAVVLDGQNCTWSTKCIGLPSVVQVGKRLALFYDAPGGDSTSHMKRHIGLAWLDLPLSVPIRNAGQKGENGVATKDSIKPSDLRCEYLENPLGIDQTQPRMSWKLENGSFLWDISVPVNSTATVHVPARDLKGVREGSDRLSEADGVTLLRMEAGRAVLHVESGTYRFTSRHDRGND